MRRNGDTGFRRSSASDAVRALRGIFVTYPSDRPRSVWTGSSGRELGDYVRGHIDGLEFATDGEETRDRLYELARQIGYVPCTGRVHIVADGGHDIFGEQDDD